MKCINCNKDIEDDIIFCPYCGAENKAKEKKLSFIEKREKKEKERLEILKKATLTKEDIVDVKEIDINYIKVDKVKSVTIKKRELLFRIILESIVILLCLGIFGVFNYIQIDINKSIQIVITFFVFIILMSAASVLVNDSHYFICLKKMSKATIAIKKILFGKDPILVVNNFIYNIALDKKCDICTNSMHLEEFEGGLFAVCDFNRQHILKVDKEKIINIYINNY